MDQFKQRKVSPKKIRACKEVKYHEKLSFTTNIWKFVTTKADFETNIGKNRLRYNTPSVCLYKQHLIYRYIINTKDLEVIAFNSLNGFYRVISVLHRYTMYMLSFFSICHSQFFV